MTAIAHHSHRVARAVAETRRTLAEVREVPLWSMDSSETAATITQLESLEAQVTELKARVLGHAEAVDLPGHVGARSTAHWYAHHTKSTRRTGHRAARLAEGLEAHGATRAALADGAISVEQAEAILRAVAELPDGLAPAVVDQAEAHLLGLAAEHDPTHLRVLGRKILEVIDPEVAEAHEARLLAREERTAAAATRLVLWDDGHGRTHGRFTLDTLTGAALKKALFAIAAPKHQASQGPPEPVGERRPTAERLGAALTEYIQRFPTKRLPKAGGLNATVIVTITLDTLLGGLAAAHLDTGATISPGAARRLACEAGIIPAVLDGPSHVLDLGRKKRFHTEAQRIAKTIEAGGCEADGCDAPPAMTHLHHPVPWSRGPTNRDAVMLCPWHHRRAHDPRYTMTRQPNGTHAFHRRT